MAKAPKACIALRSTMLTLEVTVVCKTVASDDSRLDSSPVFWVSKKAISWWSSAW